MRIGKIRRKKVIILEYDISAICVELGHLLFIANTLGSVLPGSRTERLYKIKLERSLSKLQKLGINVKASMAIIRLAGELFNLPSNFSYNL